jgi:hypothetical protein
LIGPAAIALRQPVERRHDIPLTPYVTDTPSIAIELYGHGEITSAGRVRHRYVRLQTANAAAFASHAAIELSVLTSDPPIALIGGDLIIGDSCAYVVEPIHFLPRNGLLRFRRGEGCVPPEGAAVPVTLHLRTQGGGRVLVMAYKPAADAKTRTQLIVNDPEIAETALTPQIVGNLVDYDTGPVMRRIDLLHYAWQIEATPAWIWTALGAVAVAVYVTFAFGGLIAMGSAPPLRLAAAGTLLSLCAGAVYAVVTPPFEGPDEPNHFVGYALLSGQATLEPQVRELARLGHVQRIQFDVAQRLRPYDVGRPLPPDVVAFGPALPLERSGLAPIWRWEGRALAGRPAQVQLLWLRGAGTLCMALAVGVVVFYLRSGKTPVAPLAGPLLTIVPMVPFLAMIVSNHAWIAAGYVLIAGAAVALFSGSRGREAGVGGLLAAGVTIAILGGRSALPLTPFIAALLGVRIVGTSGRRATRSQMALFWIPIGAVAPTILLVSPATMRTVVFGPLRGGWVMTLLACVLVAAAAALERALPDRATAMERFSRSRAGLARRLAILFTAGVAATMLASLFISLPRLAYVPFYDRPPLARYLRDALVSELTIFRLRDHDFLLSTSFWGAFGWLDTVPPGLTTAFVVAAAAIMVRWVWRSARGATHASLLGGALLAAGFFASFVTYAVVSVVIQPDIHGRYLLGLYLVVLTVAACGALQPEKGEASAAAGAAVALFWAAAHGYSAHAIVTRFF